MITHNLQNSVKKSAEVTNFWILLILFFEPGWIQEKIRACWLQ